MQPEWFGKRVSVLDKGFVELLDFMPHPATGVSGDLAIVNAARVSFLGESKGDEADRKLLFYLLRQRHTSPFEQVQFKFRVKMPIVVERQWVRHRTWHFNAQSYRYTEADDEDFYIPDDWRLQSRSNKQGSEGSLDTPTNAALTERLKALIADSYRLYQSALREGVAREQARVFLPAFALYSTWVLSVDAHNLINFLRLRMAKDAQYEIRLYAKAIYRDFFKPALPWTAEACEQYIFGENIELD